MMADPKTRDTAPPPTTTDAAQEAAVDVNEEEEEEYRSSEDEDYDPDSAKRNEDAQGEASSSSADEAGDDTALPSESPVQRSRKKRKSADEGDFVPDAANAAEADDSRRIKRRRGRASDSDDEHVAAVVDDDDEAGGEGGLIKTRAQRAKEGKERTALADATAATVDVDALWASMTGSTAQIERARAASPRGPSTATDSAGAIGAGAPSSTTTTTTRDGHAQRDASRAASKADGMGDEETVTIRRTYDFAGETIAEEKVVAKSSAEARLYLESQRTKMQEGGGGGGGGDVPPSSQRSKPALRRPKKRMSMFDPGNGDTTNSVTTAKSGTGTNPSPHQIIPSSSSSWQTPPPAKLNTIEKSKLDWAGFVDKEGIKDDLDEYGRAKEGYLGRMDFLGRVQQRRDGDARRGK